MLIPRTFCNTSLFRKIYNEIRLNYMFFEFFMIIGVTFHIGRYGINISCSPLYFLASIPMHNELKWSHCSDILSKEILSLMKCRMRLQHFFFFNTKEHHFPEELFLMDVVYLICQFSLILPITMKSKHNELESEYE